MTLTRFFITFLLILFCTNTFSQQAADSATQSRIDTTRKPLPVSPRKPLSGTSHKPLVDTLRKRLVDTSRRRLTATSLPVVTDSMSKKNDTLALKITPTHVKTYHSVVDSLLIANRFVNAKQPAVFFITNAKQQTGKEFIFYTLCIVVFILGLFKTFYTAYFNNLFRVFFNTSIRQTQLTDQLLQAKLPSFILNIFFTITTGIYVWLLFKYYHPPRLISSQLLLPFCITGVGVLYLTKYCILKFMGWMSGMQQAADNYIFVIFLVNKISGIIMVPFIILLTFSMSHWINYIVIFSALIMGLFFLSRYVKTFGVLEYRFPLQPLHFVIYIAAVEVVPILLIYKVVVDYVI